VWDGVDAVIDKDYAASELAFQLGADALVLITGVEAVLLDFGKETQRRLTQLDAAEAERHLAAGQFAEGSMAPKVRAAIRFIRHGGTVSVITTAPLAAATLANVDGPDESLGTRIVPIEHPASAVV
jgi:carbamate kinase